MTFWPPKVSTSQDHHFWMKISTYEFRKVKTFKYNASLASACLQKGRLATLSLLPLQDQWRQLGTLAVALKEILQFGPKAIKLRLAVYVFTSLDYTQPKRVYSLSYTLIPAQPSTFTWKLSFSKKSNWQHKGPCNTQSCWIWSLMFLKVPWFLHLSGQSCKIMSFYLVPFLIAWVGFPFTHYIP